jgi:hypothetical protein
MFGMQIISGVFGFQETIFGFLGCWSDAYLGFVNKI